MYIDNLLLCGKPEYKLTYHGGNYNVENTCRGIYTTLRKTETYQLVDQRVSKVDSR